MEEVAKPIEKLYSSDILVDIFFIVAACGIGAWLLLFTLGIFGKKDVIVFMPIVSYFVCILVVIYTFRNMYNDISRMLQKQCQDDAYFIESKNRFYNAISLVYYFTKGYLKTALNVIILFLSLFLLYVTVMNNLVYEDSFLSAYVYRQYRENDALIKALIVAYIFGGVVALGFAYAWAVRSFSLAAFRQDTRAGRLFQSGSDNFMRLSNFIKLVLIVLFFPAIIFIFEIMANIWSKLIKRHVYYIKDQDLHFFPALETLYHNNFFEYLNLTDAKLAKKHASIFVKGVVICILYACLMLPRVNMQRLCENDFDDEAKSKAKEYPGRFKFGFLYVALMIVVLHFGEFVVQGATVLVAYLVERQNSSVIEN